MTSWIVLFMILRVVVPVNRCLAMVVAANILKKWIPEWALHLKDDLKEDRKEAFNTLVVDQEWTHEW
jgi:hypothetical protein